MIRFDKKLNNDINKVVTSFNRKRRRLEKKYVNIILPDKLSVRDLKREFKNKKRRELKQVLKSYSKFSSSKKNVKSLDNYTITDWEYKKLSKDIKKYKKSLDEEIEYFKTNKPKIYGKEQATTYAMMGDVEFENVKIKRNKLNTDIKKLDKEQMLRFKKFTMALDNREKNKMSFKENYLNMLEENAFFYQIDKETADEIYNYFLEMEDNEFYDMFKEDKGIQALLDYYNMIKNISDKLDYKHISYDVVGVMSDLLENIENQKKREKLLALSK